MSNRSNHPFSTHSRVGHWSTIFPHLLWAYHGTVPDWVTEYRFNGESPPIWRLETGSVVLRFNGESTRYKAPCWILPPRRDGHQRFAPGSRLLSICSTLTWPDQSPVCKWDEAYSFPIGQHPQFERESDRLVAYIMRNFQGDDLFLQKRAGSALEVARLNARHWKWIEAFLMLLEELEIPVEAQGALDPRVSEALNLIQRIPLNQSVNEKELAAASGLSVAQLNRLFCQQVGMSPAQLRDRRRFNAADRSLLYTQETIKVIAYQLGFSSPQHFAHWFQKKTGQSPHEYRQHRRI